VASRRRCTWLACQSLLVRECLSWPLPSRSLLCSLTHDAARAVHAAASPAPFAKPRPWGPWAKTWTACGTSWVASEAASRYVCSGGTYSSSAVCQRKKGEEHVTNASSEV